MDPDIHFVFGSHPQHGYVAGFNSSLPSHLADWFLTRVQFEAVPGEPGLYQLIEPEHDGPRRTRQAAQSLRAQGYAVHVDTDIVYAPANPPGRPNGLAERRKRIAKAASGRSLQRSTAPTTSPPSARPAPPKPTYAPTVHLAGHGR
ncbi:hypothetical protein [Streptomyces sp. Wh19]|uniref:hypothetical protein n=1 Tax=Streptomyces sp. Wh19 TaxID=3076629 RepID=UPI002958D9CD|nr:hypothetical protein [Streptomyces sp. Wh19]MDV9194397.1 hypothetical protein [Streptomyces sp. Wh19]